MAIIFPQRLKECRVTSLLDRNLLCWLFHWFNKFCSPRLPLGVRLIHISRCDRTSVAKRRNNITLAMPKLGIVNQILFSLFVGGILHTSLLVTADGPYSSRCKLAYMLHLNNEHL